MMLVVYKVFWDRDGCMFLNGALGQQLNPDKDGRLFTLE